MLGPWTSFLPSNKDMIGREEMRKMGGRMERKVRMSHVEGNVRRKDHGTFNKTQLHGAYGACWKLTGHQAEKVDRP